MESDNAEIYKNLHIMLEDIAVRYGRTLPEGCQKDINALSKEEIENFLDEAYMIITNFEANYENKKKDIALGATDTFKDVADLLWDIQKKSIKKRNEFIEAILILLTIKLYMEYLDLKNSGNDHSIQELLSQYIGNSIWGDWGKELFGTVHLNSTSKDVDTALGVTAKIGYENNMPIHHVELINDIITDNNVNMQALHALSIFILFLSNHEYSIDIETKSIDKEVKRDDTQTDNSIVGQSVTQTQKIVHNDNKVYMTWAGDVDLSVPALLINICDKRLIENFYDKIQKAIEKYNKSNPVETINILSFESEKNRILNSICVFEENNKTDFLKLLLNVDIIYNVLTNMSKTLRDTMDRSTPWNACCSFFDTFIEELEKIDEFYSNIIIGHNSDVSNIIHDKKFSALCKRKLPTLNDKSADNFMYLDKREQEYFNSIFERIRITN